MGRYAADTVKEFLQNMINVLIEDHDPDEDGASTGGVVSLYRLLKDRVDDGIPWNAKRGTHIAQSMVDLIDDDGESYNISDIDALADEINSWR